MNPATLNLRYRLIRARKWHARSRHRLLFWIAPGCQSWMRHLARRYIEHGGAGVHLERLREANGYTNS